MAGPSSGAMPPPGPKAAPADPRSIFPPKFYSASGAPWGTLASMEIFLSICLGIGLSAACGFRVFVPLLCLSIAAKAGYVHLTPSFAWIGTLPAIIAFGVATVLEIGAYYIPWLDNVLDSA